MHQQGDEANIPPALIPRRMFLWAPLTHLSRRREGLARSVKSLCAIAVQYYEEETHSTGHVDKEAHGTYRLVGTWKYHWMATFWCGQVNRAKCECLTTNKNKWLKSCILTHLDMKASMRDGERSQGSEMHCKKKHYDGQEEGGGTIVPFGLQKR